MEQKAKLGCINIVWAVCLLHACNTEPVVNNKDLAQNMMDLRIYQENLGDHIKTGRLDGAQWLLDGMDSIMVLLADRVNQHRKLTKPFSEYYEKLMRDPVEQIRTAITDNDTVRAINNYRVLIKNCNGCHIDLEVDKEVKY